MTSKKDPFGNGQQPAGQKSRNVKDTKNQHVAAKKIFSTHRDHADDYKDHHKEYKKQKK